MDSVTPTLKDQGVTTAPTPSAAEEIAQLRAEIERLQAVIATGTPEGEAGADRVAEGAWPRRITYGRQVHSGSQLSGLSRERERIRPSTDFPELPAPTRDQEQLEADFIRWGYCLVADAMSPDQVRAQVDRLVDQAEAERAAGVARRANHGHSQTIFNLLAKGQVFRDLSAFEPSAAQGGPLVEDLVSRILGAGYHLATAHGSLVHERGGLQELHQDQGFVPLPHPPFPLYCLLIWLYTDFGLEEGGTYIVPGSHRDALGRNLVRPDSNYAHLAEERIVALTAPAGTCLVTDSRVLHSGGKRTQPGTRLASRILYARPEMRQQETQLACLTDAELAALSPKLKGLVGFRTFSGLGMVDGNTTDPDKPVTPIGELSLSRPASLNADFDWRYSEHARQLAASDPEVDYRGPRNPAANA
jgi:ectoine hydroxylase-related dioxygenase (phytanoyl-CoA dioxygenase family)